MTIYPAGIVQDSGGKLSSAQLSGCDSFTIGYTLGVTIHEYLHSICGLHSIDGSSDCVGVAMGIAMAHELCKDADEIDKCLAGNCPPGSPYFEMGAAKLMKLKKGLCARIGDAEKRHNGKEGSGHANSCAGMTMPEGCLPESYNNTMPAPPNGWRPPAEGETGNWPIPACAASD